VGIGRLPRWFAAFVIGTAIAETQLEMSFYELLRSGRPFTPEWRNIHAEIESGPTSWNAGGSSEKPKTR
jgi:hypothetical protein